MASKNQDVDALRHYHEATKHSLASVTSSGHMLDWTNHPRLWKLYDAELPATPLPRQVASSGATLFEALAGVGRGDLAPADDARAGRPRPYPGLKDLSALLQLSAGVTKLLKVPGGSMPFRAAACTGALYHIELYAVCRDLPGLPAGAYHFSVHDASLRRLRDGDYRGVLAQAAADEAHLVAAPAILVYTSDYARNAWKYQERCFRHCFWDSGTILANTLAVASARNLAAAVVTGFVDREVSRLLDLDADNELPIALVPIGEAERPAPAPPTMEPLGLAAVPPTRRPIAYPAVVEAHRASELANAEEVHPWRTPAPMPPTPGRAGARIPLKPLGAMSLPSRTVEEVIVRRGSSRRFERRPISFDALSTMLPAAVRPVPMDATAFGQSSLTDAHVIVNAVDGLDPGAYVFREEESALEPLRVGDEWEMRRAAAHLALTQALGGDAAVNVYFLADLDRVLGQFGNRGYRVAHLDASIKAGRLYVAAYALGLGASGLTFFDDEVAAFFGRDPKSTGVMFLIALGVAGKGTGDGGRDTVTP